jgi:sec-independent protein translocase protein TatB
MPFNINSWEILVILMLFVLLFGPEKLPEVAIQIGRLVRELREATQAATEEITRELHSAAADQKEAAEDVRKIGDSARKILQDASDSVTASLSGGVAESKPKSRTSTALTADAQPSSSSASVSDSETAEAPASAPQDPADAVATNQSAVADDSGPPTENVPLPLDGPDRMIPDEER